MAELKRRGASDTFLGPERDGKPDEPPYGDCSPHSADQLGLPRILWPVLSAASSGHGRRPTPWISEYAGRSCDPAAIHSVEGRTRYGVSVRRWHSVQGMGAGHRYFSYQKPEFPGSRKRELRLRRKSGLNQYLFSPYNSGRLNSRLGANTAITSAVAPWPNAPGIFKPNRGIQGGDYRRPGEFLLSARLFAARS